MMDMLAQAALSLSDFPLSIVTKATAIVAIALIAVRCARRAAASMRYLVLSSAFAVLLLLPLAEVVAPPITIAVDRADVVPALGPIVMAAGTGDTPRATPAPAALESAGPSTGASILSATELLLIAWAAGALLCLLPVLLTPWRLRQLRRTARSWPHGDALVRKLASGRCSRRIALLVHDEVAAPITCGVARPVIMLPADAPRWSGADLQRALVHELEHVRRADWPVHVAARAVCALYWFHPLVWMAWRRLRLDAERACDDAVLHVAEGAIYAQQLVTLARRRATPSARLALSMAGRSDLSARIAAVLDETQERGRLGPARGTAIVAAVALLAAAVAPLRATLDGPRSSLEQATAAPAFEVVSVRPNTSGEPGWRSRREPGGRIVMTNAPLWNLILQAYALQPQQLVAAPAWVDSARFDIIAQAKGELPMTPPNTVGPAQLMMQRLLADRFNLVVHTETRELPIYALTLARSDGRLGPRITPSQVDCEAAMKALLNARGTGGAPPQEPRLPDGRDACGAAGMSGRLLAGGTSLRELAGMLPAAVGRLVEDRTGLKGRFDFDLEFDPASVTMPGGVPDVAPPNPNLPSLFTALEEQLGLKLQATNAPVEVLVIDRVEPPTEN